jgi:hypothetical protein
MYLIGDPPKTSALPKCDTTIDAKAQKIIDAAADTSVSADTRAIQAFTSIMSTYYSRSGGKFDKVSYDATEKGLLITYKGSGEKLRGDVVIGEDFLRNMTSKFFARRVLQVGHEIIHVNQQRKGMSGKAMKARREFGAHSWAALTPTFTGTGCITHSTRVAMIDCALRHYYCMSEKQRKQHKSRIKPLLTRRPLEVKASGKTFDPAPSSCSWDKIKSTC